MEPSTKRRRSPDDAPLAKRRALGSSAGSSSGSGSGGGGSSSTGARSSVSSASGGVGSSGGGGGAGGGSSSGDQRRRDSNGGHGSSDERLERDDRRWERGRGSAGASRAVRARHNGGSSADDAGPERPPHRPPSPPRPPPPVLLGSGAANGAGGTSAPREGRGPRPAARAVSPVPHLPGRYQHQHQHHHRQAAPPLAGAPLHRGSPSRHARTHQPQQQSQSVQQHASADKDGHYLVRVNEDLTQRYKILSMRGEGTFGKVVECYDRQERKHVAIKIIRSTQRYREAARVEIRVLETLKSHDSHDRMRCIRLLEWFDFRNHICMVYDLYGQSIFDFLRDNMYYPFPLKQIRSIAAQLLTAVAYMHGLRMIHTDIKPENILFTSSDFESSSTGSRRALLNTSLKLIDFGSTVFAKDRHTSVVSTRHYRAPEIILGLGWSYECDLWSIGCVLVELYSGETMFQTHDNLEHLAMMQRMFGPFPKHMQQGSTCEQFFYHGRLSYPAEATSSRSELRVARLKPLKELIFCHDELSRMFVDLLDKLLQIDPHRRVSAKTALRHAFFDQEPYAQAPGPD